MRFLLWEINYVGFGKTKLSRYNRRLVKRAKREPTMIYAIKLIRFETGASLKDAKDFYDKYVR